MKQYILSILSGNTSTLTFPQLFQQQLLLNCCLQQQQKKEHVLGKHSQPLTSILTSTPSSASTATTPTTTTVYELNNADCFGSSSSLNPPNDSEFSVFGANSNRVADYESAMDEDEEQLNDENKLVGNQRRHWMNQILVTLMTMLILSKMVRFGLNFCYFLLISFDNKEGKEKFVYILFAEFNESSENSQGIGRICKRRRTRTNFSEWQLSEVTFSFLTSPWAILGALYC